VRIVVLGAAGNFGARVTRALQSDPAVDLIGAGRNPAAIPSTVAAQRVALDIDSTDFPAQLAKLSPGLVIHCVGPFQGQDYHVASASLAAGAHYLDLADGRQFVAGFASALDTQAVVAGRAAISGASTLPALSSAVVDELRDGLSAIESIEVVIAPGQRAPRGKATLEAVFSYLGRPFPVWRNGRWRRAWGWMDLREVRLDIGARLAAACDVPDLAVFPETYRSVQTVTFHAALEFGAQHLALWTLAALRRVGLPLPVTQWAVALNPLAGMFESAAGDKGGMSVTVVGSTHGRTRVRRCWQLTVTAMDGPEIPCLPAVLLARRFAKGPPPSPGARACVGLLKLSDFGAEFARWRITTRTEEVAA